MVHFGEAKQVSYIWKNIQGVSHGSFACGVGGECCEFRKEDLFFTVYHFVQFGKVLARKVNVLPIKSKLIRRETWMNAPVDGWVDGWMDESVGGQLGGWMDGWMSQWVGRWVDGWMDESVGEQVGGWMDG